MQGVLTIFVQGFELVGFFSRAGAETCHTTIFQDGTVFIDTTAAGLRILGPQFQRNAVGVFKLVLQIAFGYFDEDFGSHKVGVIFGYQHFFLKLPFVFHKQTKAVFTASENFSAKAVALRFIS